jgi:hypothetical protein
MNKDQLKKFIKDTRGLIRGAPDHKKVKLLQLIKEAKRRCDERELNEMELDSEKVDETIGSKYATAALAGALRAGGVTIGQQDDSHQEESSDYLEEK